VLPQLEQQLVLYLGHAGGILGAVAVQQLAL